MTRFRPPLPGRSSPGSTVCRATPVQTPQSTVLRVERRCRHERDDVACARCRAPVAAGCRRHRLRWSRITRGLRGGSVTPVEAASHVGERATVCGLVASATYADCSRGQPTFLNLDKPFQTISSARDTVACRLRAGEALRSSGETSLRIRWPPETTEALIGWAQNRGLRTPGHPRRPTSDLTVGDERLAKRPRGGREVTGYRRDDDLLAGYSTSQEYVFPAGTRVAATAALQQLVESWARGVLGGR